MEQLYRATDLPYSRDMDSMKLTRLTSYLGAALLLTMTLACTDDGGGEENEGSEATSGETSDSASSGETGSGTNSGDGDGDPNTGDGDGDPNTGDGDGDPNTGDGDGDPNTGDGDGDPNTGDGDGDPNTGDGDGDPNTGDGDGDPGSCADINSEDACDANPDCQSVLGSPLVQGNPNSPACLDPLQFLGCIPQQGCGDALTWFCAGDETFLVIDTCGPPNAEMCQPPIDGIPPECD